MAKPSVSIGFKQTTSDWFKCYKCGASIFGADGFVKVNTKYTHRRWDNNIRLSICNECFKKLMEKITKARDNKEESYKKMVKTKILKSLK